MTTPITSRNNPRIKMAAKLRDQRGRRTQQRIIIDGVREIGRALDAGIVSQEAFVCESIVNEEVQTLQQRLAKAGCDVVPVNQSVFAKLAFGDRSDGIVAVATPPSVTLDDLTVRPAMLIVVLENVEKPGNVGAILRSADAAGASAVIVADGGTDLYNPNSIRASAGTIFALPVIACASDEVLGWLRRHAFHILTARVDGAVDYTSVDYVGSAAIVVGSEANGLSHVWQGDDIMSIRLPMHGVGDSLNVSVTTAVVLFEALRQRHSEP